MQRFFWVLLLLLLKCYSVGCWMIRLIVLIVFGHLLGVCRKKLKQIVSILRHILWVGLRP